MVFHGDGGRWFSALLRPGFHHCFAAINDGRAWIVVNLTTEGLLVTADIDAGFDLAGYFRGHGMTVIETECGAPGRAPWLGPFTCVGMVKCMLFLPSAAVTPYRLYRFLERRQRGR